jgi:hypothetical protein
MVVWRLACDIGFVDAMRQPECGSALPHPIGIGG